MTTIALSPNQPIKLRPADEDHQYSLRVLDSLDGNLVVRVPPDLADAPVPDSVELAFGYRNQYWHGEARVEAVFDRWWFLAQPTEADCQAVQRRSFVRIAFDDALVAIPTNPLGEPMGEPRRAQLANLSAGGCLAHMPADLQPGDHLLLLLSLPNMPVSPVISGVVRRGEETDSGVWYGVRFESLGDREQEELARFVASYIQDKLREGVDVTQPEAGV